MDVRDVIDDTRLHDACLHNNPAIAALLLEFGADVDARNNTLNTPLHRTTCFGSVESARVLLRAGAEVNGWANYERQHLDKLTLMLTPKDDGRRRSRRRLSPLRRLPPEVLRKIAAFAFHAGFY